MKNTPKWLPVSSKVTVGIGDAGVVYKCKYNSPTSIALVEKKTPAKRGCVDGFSRKSRQRLRMLLVSAAYHGYEVHGITLTIPGDIIPEELADSLFHKFHYILNRRGYFAVWRKEIQARGMLHWHCLVWCSKKSAVNLKFDWGDVIDSLGPYQGTCRCKGDLINVSATTRMALFGAHEHAAVIKVADSDHATRYLLDHSSKSKQAQSATHGRAWGVINRAKMPKCEFDARDIKPAAVDMFCRYLRRLYAYRVKADCVFGTRIEHKSNRRLKWHGEHPLMGKTDAVRRLIDWCNSQV